MQEAPTGPPVNRAAIKGIPTVSVDRMVGSRRVSAHITGNFPANGAQQGMYLIHKLLKESPWLPSPTKCTFLILDFSRVLNDLNAKMIRSTPFSFSRSPTKQNEIVPPTFFV